jgi:hypothetical protein
MFLYGSYVEKKSYKSCKIKFNRKCPGVCVLDLSMIYRSVKKVHSTRSVLDNKYTRQNAMLTKAAYNITHRSR